MRGPSCTVGPSSPCSRPRSVDRPQPGWGAPARCPVHLPPRRLIMSDIIDATAIRELNDRFRQSLAGGVLVMTAGVIALGPAHQQKILEAVARFKSFDEGNDPYGEHGFGSLE